LTIEEGNAFPKVIFITGTCRQRIIPLSMELLRQATENFAKKVVKQCLLFYEKQTELRKALPPHAVFALSVNHRHLKEKRQ
jgi:hypothetical protein